MRFMSFLVSTALGCAGLSSQANEPVREMWIGAAQVDITPSYPVRLTGYAARSGFSEGTAQPLYAKAIAFGSDEEGPRLMLAVDNCGVPAGIVEEVARRLANSARIRREDLVVASTHTHSAPMVRGFAENIFIRDLNAEEDKAVNRYTAELTDHLEAVARKALENRKRGSLYWGRGKVEFAANRRTQGGPVDHSLPFLLARDSSNRPLALVANYACHCTTLGHQINRHHGDWAGYAKEQMEKDHPGAIALVTIGCGADANPHPRGGEDFGLALALRHGLALAAEVNHKITEDSLIQLTSLPATRIRRIILPFDPLPSRQDWERRASQPGIVGYHAQKNLQRLDQGEALPTHLPYVVQSWVFEDRLAMVFMAGEVVVDYALRLKERFDPERLWITAYANDVPCYIPSRRILKEGGYEAQDSLWYYDRPARLAPEVEELIHGALSEIVPATFQTVGQEARR